MTGVPAISGGQHDTVELPPPWPGADVRLADRTLFVREARSTGAQPEPAVMIHGLGGSSLNWTDLMAALQDRLAAVAPDLSGFGASPPPRDGDYSPAGHARGMAALIEHRFGRRAVHVFGNSLGGAVAVQLAARRPDLVASLTLVSPALPDLRPKRTNVHLPIASIPGVGEAALRRYARVDASARTRATLQLCFGDPTRVNPRRFAEAVEELERRDDLPYAGDALLGSLRGLIATYLDAGRDRPWRLAERITCPVLLVYGRADKLVDVRAAHRASRHFRDVRITVLSDTGHVAQIEHPDRVALAWTTLLDRRRPTTP
ncbi:MAG: alpha/beta fold hydrolase [Actinomycetota bacterium]|nr:MAG: alpha/beta fold hydrolase [Actinomycetota bacterium]